MVYNHSWSHIVIINYFLELWLNLLTIQTPLWPFREPLRNPNPQYLVRPDPSSLQTTNKHTSIIGLNPDSWFRVIIDKVTLYSHDPLMLPNFFIQPLRYLFVTVSRSKRLIRYTRRIGSDQNHLRSMSFYFDEVHWTFDLFDCLVDKFHWVIILFFLSLFDILLTTIGKFLFDGRSRRNRLYFFFIIFLPIPWPWLPVIFLKQIILSRTIIVVFFIRLNLPLLSISGSSTSSLRHPLDLYLDLFSFKVNHLLALLPIILRFVQFTIVLPVRITRFHICKLW